MKWTKLIINLNPMAVEAVANMVLELGIEGIEIDDNILSDEDKEAMYVGYVDESIVPLDEHRVIAYLDENQDVMMIKGQVEDGLNRVKEFLELGSAHIEIEEMPEENYEEKWKDFYSSFRVGERIIVTPIWEEAQADEDDILIKVDPGMAFGSGTHETTSMCMEILLDENVEGKSVVDVGCGSGILGITAAKLGASEISGVDIDEAAVSIAKENVLTNEVDKVMSVYHGNLLDQVSKKVDVVVANILADVIIMIAGDVKKILADDGIFIASGIILDKVEEVQVALKAVGFSKVVVREQGEWAAMTARI